MLGKNMKQPITRYILAIIIFCMTGHATCNSNVACREKNNSFFLCATERFKCMKVQDIRNMNIFALNAIELKAFKALAKEIFSREIASADCFSQANRRKYEVMYQKIGQFDAALHVF